MSETVVVCHSFLPDGQLARWQADFPGVVFHDARSPEAFVRHKADATIAFGLPPFDALAGMTKLRWLQLASAGVPGALCPLASERSLRVTNLAGLYGPSIAEHALGMMLILSRNLHVAYSQQAAKIWDQSVNRTMRNLAGSTLGVIGLGNIGVNIARLGQAMGMRVVGCRRSAKTTPYVDQVYACSERNRVAAEADVVAVAAPLTRDTDAFLGREFFAAMRPGALIVNVARGAVIDESALIEALQTGKVGGAGLDVFAVEPLPAESPLWTLPNVVVSPHYSGDVVNFSTAPADRFTRNLRNWLSQRDLEGSVLLDLGY
ncbi:MAG: D-2-hydroxyacid dehydrogenase [Planctomycetota bacterium]